MLAQIILRIKIAVRDWLNTRIDPEWKKKQAQNEKDAAALQQQHGETVRENAESDKQVAINDAKIEASQTEVRQVQAEIAEHEVEREKERRRIRDASSLDDIVN